MPLGHVSNTMLQNLELQNSEPLAEDAAAIATNTTLPPLREERLIIRVNQGSWPEAPQRSYRGTNKLRPLSRHEDPPKRPDPNQEPGSWPTQSQREKDFNDSMPIAETAEWTAEGIAVVTIGILLSCRIAGTPATMAALKSALQSELATKLGITLTGVSLVEFGKWFDAAWYAEGNPEKIRDAQDAFKIWASAAGPLVAAKALRELGGASQAVTTTAPAATTLEPAGNNWLTPLMNERGGVLASLFAGWAAWRKVPNLSRLVMAEAKGTPWEKLSLQERGEAVGRAVNRALRERRVGEVRVNVIVNSEEAPAASEYAKHYVFSPGTRSITVDAKVLPTTFEHPDMSNVELEGGMAWLLGSITQEWSAGSPDAAMSNYMRKLFKRPRSSMVE